MRKIVSAASLAVVLGLFSMSGPDLATGQDKKEVKKDAGKPGSVEVYKAKDGYRFRIKDADGKSLAVSTKGQEDKAACMKVLETIKVTLNNAKPGDSKD
ncbi:MAG TPA: hypothetical protein VGL71_04985 [Urbifossiella sp.]